MSFKITGMMLFFFIIVFPAFINAEMNPPSGMEFVPIKGGCYEMGDIVGDGDANERPVHEVCVRDFSIGKFTVTNEQFRMFRPKHDSGMYKGFSLNGDKQPVVNISWEDAVAFAKWLSKKTGKTYRLPTEAEWEYAARAGTKTSRFWGNNPDDACTYANVADLTAKKHWPRWTVHVCDDGYAVSAPVGSFKPNEYGIYDMLGNAWQWCEDVYNSGAYARLPKNDPVYEGSGEYRVMRGGGWSNGPLGIRSSHRVPASPIFGHPALGFRLVQVN
jgi:formylglycine-generating enzyme required for sulfatase activity